MARSSNRSSGICARATICLPPNTGKVGPKARLPDGRTRLRRVALRTRSEHGPRTEAPKGSSRADPIAPAYGGGQEEARPAEEGGVGLQRRRGRLSPRWGQIYLPPTT